MKRYPVLLLSFFVGLVSSPVTAGIVPHALFSDHAVLQQGMKVPVWGTAEEGEPVMVEFASQTKAAVTVDGKWMIFLEPLEAGGPFEMVIRGRTETVTLKDILVGEVWICSGQSNMERQLGLRNGQKPIVGWEEEVAAANHPQIRQFNVPNRIAPMPVDDVSAEWVVCSPQTVEEFTAVGYFFGRDIHLTQDVPVGLVQSTWGGTPIEAWTSAGTLSDFPGFEDPLMRLTDVASDPAGAFERYSRDLEKWYADNDPGSREGDEWFRPDLDTTEWSDMRLPTLWEDAGFESFDGVGWLRREIKLGPGWEGAAAVLLLSTVDDNDKTWVNGMPVGETVGYDEPRVYVIPEGVLREGVNVIAVRVLDTGGGGGIGSESHSMLLRRVAAEPQEKAIRLSGGWKFKPAISLGDAPRPPQNVAVNSHAPTVLYNGMIAPLWPYAIRGVTWYQGESNVTRAREYRSLFPAMIADWREIWNQGDFPFLFVQIAPYKTMTPELREAQLLTLKKSPNTAMAVTIDCGDAEDIHPADKRPVGQRLALAARALVYGEVVQYSGPVYSAMSVVDDEVVLRFSHVGGGLTAKGGELTGFTMAGNDGVFHPAEARIDNYTVVVSSGKVPEPVAVRYAWSNVPEASLFSKAGLPASPFRTDVD